MTRRKRHRKKRQPPLKRARVKDINRVTLEGTGELAASLQRFGSFFPLVDFDDVAEAEAEAHAAEIEDTWISERNKSVKIDVIDLVPTEGKADSWEMGSPERYSIVLGKAPNGMKSTQSTKQLKAKN